MVPPADQWEEGKICTYGLWIREQVLQNPACGLWNLAQCLWIHFHGLQMCPMVDKSIPMDFHIIFFSAMLQIMVKAAERVLHTLSWSHRIGVWPCESLPIILCSPPTGPYLLLNIFLAFGFNWQDSWRHDRKQVEREKLTLYMGRLFYPLS